MLSEHKSHESIVLLCVVFLTNVYPVMLREQHDRIRAVEKLLSENKPIVLVLNSGVQEINSDFDELFNNNGDGLEDDDAKVTDKGSLLDHFLRDDKMDELVSNVHGTKEILRSVLRARCQQVEKCMKKCPPKQLSCSENCQVVYDNTNLCTPIPEPKKCKRQKCGKTMPPFWRF